MGKTIVPQNGNANRCRIDDPHSALSNHDPAAFTLNVAASGFSEQEPDNCEQSVTSEFAGAAELFASEHLSDLIGKLQAWSVRLDRREAELNARQALLNHRERTVRMQLQSQEKALQQRERVVQRDQQTVEAQVRRLALANLPLGTR
ncbi:MAG: hypothetical protein R3C05_06595 [Pirellulaceae bacterium]